MGILDSLFAQGGLLSGLLPGGAQAQPGTQPTPQATTDAIPQGPGMGERLSAGLQGLVNSPTMIGGLGHLAGGLLSGQRTDPQGVQQGAIRAQLSQMVNSGQITPTQAQYLAANPKSWEELAKSMINQPVTVAPSGDILVTRPFGQIGIPTSVPISDNTQVTNPDGSRSPAYTVRPSLSRPGGGIVLPGQNTAPSAGAPPGPAPAPSAAGPARPLLNPNAPNGGRPIITEASPALTKEREAVGTDNAATLRSINDRAVAAGRQLNTLSLMRQLGPRAFEGAAANAQQFLRSLGTSLGLPSGTVEAGTVFTALSNKMVIDTQPGGSLGAGVSNADVGFIANTVPSLTADGAGRMQLIEIQSRLARREQEIAREALAFRRANGGSMDGFQVHLQEWANRQPSLFGDLPQPRPAATTRPGGASAAPAVPAVGERRGDFEFLGGNPANQESWRRWRGMN